MQFNEFKNRATEQANQLRIVLIAISVGVAAFLAQDINGSISFVESPALYLATLCSVFAVIAGLFAWNYSSKLFFLLGDDAKNEDEKNKAQEVIDLWQKRFDTWLRILLILSVLFSGYYLMNHKKPSHNNLLNANREHVNFLVVAFSLFT